MLVWPWRDIAFLEVQLSARFRRRYPQGPSDFGKLVWEAMKKKGITRRDMAEKLGLPKASLSALTTGRALILTYHHWDLIIENLGLTQEQLEEAERTSVAIEIGRAPYSRGRAIRFLIGKQAFELDDTALGALVRRLAGDK